MNVRWPSIVAGAAGVVLTLLPLYLGFGGYIAYKLTHVERRQITNSPGELGLPFSEVVFASKDGVSLAGWQVETATANPATNVVFVHGIGDNRAQHHHIELARHLAGQGIGSFLFDLRGHGESGGSLVSGGFFEQQDVIAAVQQVPADTCRIVFGSSLGGAIAILAANQLEGDIDGLIVDSVYADIADLLAEEIERSLSLSDPVARIFIPGASLMAKIIYGIDLAQLVPEQTISNLPYPTLIIHGQNDARIPVAHAKRLHLAAKPNSELLVVEGADHTESYITETNTYLAAVNKYVQGSCQDYE